MDNVDSASASASAFDDLLSLIFFNILDVPSVELSSITIISNLG